MLVIAKSASGKFTDFIVTLMLMLFLLEVTLQKGCSLLSILALEAVQGLERLLW